MHSLNLGKIRFFLKKTNKNIFVCLVNSGQGEKKEIVTLGTKFKIEIHLIWRFEISKQECSYPMLTKYMLNFAILFIHSKVVFDLIYYFDLTKEDSEEMAFLLSQR